VGDGRSKRLCQWQGEKRVLSHGVVWALGFSTDFSVASGTTGLAQRWDFESRACPTLYLGWLLPAWLRAPLKGMLGAPTQAHVSMLFPRRTRQYGTGGEPAFLRWRRRWWRRTWPVTYIKLRGCQQVVLTRWVL
jgi:hypothetical protein